MSDMVPAGDGDNGESIERRGVNNSPRTSSSSQARPPYNREGSSSPRENYSGRDGSRDSRPMGGDRYNQDRPGQDRPGQDRFGQGNAAGADRQKQGAMEVPVEHNIEKAMKILKRKLIKEGLFKELKARRYYEKPSERKKRKGKESVKKIRKEEARSRKNSTLM